ncbi:MAG: Ig-like domain-containing protein [Terriglobales bacterium]
MGGDGVYSGGTSSPVAVTVAPEGSSVGTWATVGGYPFQSGSTIPYGDSISLFAQPKGTASGFTTATGSVNFILDGQTAGTVPLNVKGIGTWITPEGAAPGLHSVTASYPGDASYSPSQSAAFSYTVNQQTSSLDLGPGGVCGSGITCTAYAGDTVPVEVYLEGFGAAIPSGTVRVTLGSQSQAVTMSAGGFDEIHNLTGIAEFSNLTPGTYQLSATYSGDSNYQGASGGPFTIVVAAPSGLRVATTTTITEASATVSYPFGTMGGFTVTVTGASGSSGPPTGAVTVYSNGLGEASVTLAPSGPNSASGSSGSAVGDYFNLGLNQITAVYTGDSTYQESVSAPIILTAVEAGTTPDFTLAPQVPQFVVPEGGSANTSINLASVFAFSGAVSLSCTTSSTVVGCTVSPSSVNLSGTAKVTLTVNSTARTTAMSTDAPRSKRWTFWLSGGAVFLGCCFLGGFSRGNSGKRRMGMMAIAASVFLSLTVACGGGQSTTKVITPPQQPPNPLITYSVVVSAAGNGIVHNTTVSVSVQ